MSTSNHCNTIPFVYGFLCVLSMLIICIYEQVSQAGITLTLLRIPLIFLMGGFLPSIIIRFHKVPIYLRYVYRCALSFLFTYAFLQAILEIQGTASPHIKLYLIVSILLFVLTFLLGIGTYMYHRFYLQHKVRKQ